MALVEFINNQEPYINAENLNNNFNECNNIVESGSTELGSYIKYSDGTMICYKTISGTIDITTAWGSLYTSTDIAIGWFPVNFISRPTILFSPQTQSGTQYMIVGNGGGNSGDFSRFGNVALVRPTSRTGVPYIIDAMAIGKWK